MTVMLNPGRDARRLAFCAYENRPANWGAVLILARSLARHDPDTPLHLCLPGASAELLRELSRLPSARTSTDDVRHGAGPYAMKPRVMLSALDFGYEEVAWIDTDIVVCRSVAATLASFGRGSVVVAEEWYRPPAGTWYTEGWGLRAVRPMPRVNSGFVRVDSSHRGLLHRWDELMHRPAFRDAQSLPAEERDPHLTFDQDVLTALLGSEEFGGLPLEWVRCGKGIVQCAGFAGMSPGDRVASAFRGMPALVHALGRKPWAPLPTTGSSARRYLLAVDADVSPYTLACLPHARTEFGVDAWLRPRTGLGRVLRFLHGSHPGLTGFVPSVLHTISRRLKRR